VEEGSVLGMVCCTSSCPGAHTTGDVVNDSVPLTATV
jgi:hypothetical protein